MSFIRHTLGLFSSNVFVVLVSFLLGILTARFLEPEGKGLLYFALQVVSLGTVVLSSGFGPTYQYFISSGKEDLNKVLAFALCHVGIIIVILFSVISSIRLVEVNFGLTIIDFRLLLLISLGILLNIVNLFTSSFLLTRQEGLVAHSKFLALGALVNLLTILILVVIQTLNFKTALWANYFGIFIQILARLAIISRIGIRLDFMCLWMLARNFISFAAPSFITNAALILVFKVNTFFILEILGAKSLGIFSMSIAFAEISLVLPNTVGTVLFTKIPSLEPSKKLEMLLRSNRTILFVALVSSLTIIFVAPLLVNQLLGSEYSESILPLQVLAPGLIFMASNYTLTNFYNGSGNVWLVARTYVIGLALNVFMNFILIHHLELVGASLAADITYMFISGIFYYYLLLNHPVRLRRLLFFDFNDLMVLRYYASRYIYKK